MIIESTGTLILYLGFTLLVSVLPAVDSLARRRRQPPSPLQQGVAAADTPARASRLIPGRRVTVEGVLGARASRLFATMAFSNDPVLFIC